RCSQLRREHSSLSEFQINNAVGRNDAVFIFHVLARAKIDTSTGVFNQEPPGCNVPQADPLFDVGVESSTGDISKVESSASEDPAFPDPMNHLLKQWKVRVDRLLGFREPNRNNCFGEICPIAHETWTSIQFWDLTFLSFPHFPTNRVVNNADNDLVAETQSYRDAEMRKPVEIIHRAIKRSDDPLVLAGVIAHNALF